MIIENSLCYKLITYHKATTVHTLKNPLLRLTTLYIIYDNQDIIHCIE